MDFVTYVCFRQACKMFLRGQREAAGVNEGRGAKVEGRLRGSCEDRAVRHGMRGLAGTVVVGVEGPRA